jgi:hypothetical protein
MHMNARTVITVLILVLIFSCHSKKDPLAKAWIYDDNQTAEQTSENATLYRATEDLNMTGANFMDLRPDSSYTSYLNGYDLGRWYFKDDELILVSQNKSIREWEVKKVDAHELVCIDKMKNHVYRFMGYNNDFKSPSENPFALENNQWRMKARHKESDKEIAARLKNHFRFWEKYFAWGFHNKIDYLDVQNTPGVLEMYSNGFKLQYYNYEMPEWKNAFYDTADAWKAYEKVYYSMYAKEIDWPKTDNRFERFVSAFKQMQRWME